MHSNITVLIHTYNQENNIKACINSVKNIAQDVIVIDNYSRDNTTSIAKSLGAHVYRHKYSGQVEKSRNFGVRKVKTQWVFVLDADERSSKDLNKKLLSIANLNIQQDVILIPRQNYIFGKWIQHTSWWPDHQARFFRKGNVNWSGDLDIVNIKSKRLLYLDSIKSLSLIHYNYKDIDSFISKLNIYTNFYAKRLMKEKVKVNYFTPFLKAIKEFNSRFFFSEGYKDGYIGLLLSIFMSLYFFLSYIKVIEKKKNLFKIQGTLFFFQIILLTTISQLFFWFFISLLLLSPYRFIKQALINVIPTLKR